MKAERAAMLAELLREMRDTAGGYFPEAAWPEIHRAFALPYVELVIPRYSARGVEFYLRRRPDGDVHWPGSPWHIPGGLWRVAQTQREACEATAQRELGLSVRSLREVMTYKWPDHPYANPISHVCLCELSGPVPLSDAGAFFPISDLPQPVLLHHDEFLLSCARHLRREPAPA